MKSDLISSAWQGIYPNQEFSYHPVLKYSGKFRGFNANIRLRSNVLTVAMSRQWRGVSRDIQIGLIQELMVRLFRKQGLASSNTANIRLYNSFLKNVHLAVPKTRDDYVLGPAFERLNSSFFAGMMQKPNLVWFDGARTLGLYDYGTDTIKISRALAKDDELRDYVLYHEMLHKKHKFSSKPGRCLYHSREFRNDEKKFPNAELLENRLKYVGIRKLPGKKRNFLLDFFGI